MITTRDLYTHSFPLGPIAEEVSGIISVDRRRLELLFDSKNKLVNQLNRELSLIIGRKGSGKTTLLTSVEIRDPKAKSFYLPTSDLFSAIVRQINYLSDGVVFVEQVSRLWDFALWGVIFHYISVEYQEPEIIEYCHFLGVLPEEQTPYEVIRTMLDSLQNFPPEDWPLPEKIAYKKIGKISFLQAKSIASSVLGEQHKHIYLLMDSLEDFKVELSSFGTALAGLLRCLGEFNESRDTHVSLRCCLPAERYYDFSALSTNAIKDFRWGILLHWSAGELIHLCATRLSRYIKEYFPSIYSTHFFKLNLQDREDLSRFWDIIFPQMVTNNFGTQERPIAYILRHTQLLPRHVLLLLNEIIAHSLKCDDDTIIGIDPNRVREGIAIKENLIVEQILGAYKTPNRDAASVAAAIIPELPMVFDWSDFDRAAARAPRHGFLGIENRGEMLAALAEIGAVGRIVDESERYVEGVFEYMLPSRLIFSERDRFCIHPLFARRFNANTKYTGAKPVYTYWSGIVDSDLEHWK